MPATITVSASDLDRVLHAYEGFRQSRLKMLERARAEWIPVQVNPALRPTVRGCAENILAGAEHSDLVASLDPAHQLAVALCVMDGMFRLAHRDADAGVTVPYGGTWDHAVVVERAYGFLKTVQPEFAFLALRNGISRWDGGQGTRGAMELIQRFCMTRVQVVMDVYLKLRQLSQQEGTYHDRPMAASPDAKPWRPSR